MELIRADWYQSLIDDCSSLIVESEFASRWSMIEGRHLLGKRILQEEKNFGEIPFKDIVATVARDVNRSTRTVYRAVQFYKKFPDLDRLPEGKDISYKKIVTKYLPDSKRPIKPKVFVCPKCSHQFKV